MRVGIMTWFTYHNYGTALQVTALTSRVKALGHEPSVINYKPDSRMKSIKREGLFRFLAVRIVRRIAGLFRPRHRNYAPAEREAKFLRFLGENISLTEKCDTMQELEDVAKNFDAVICGSDQIWSPLGLDAHYYLDFVHDRAKKAAYAPSIDTNHVRSEAVRQRVIALAGDIAYLSVREKASAETLSLWLNRKVEAVLDPALLLKASEWEKYTYTDLQTLPTGGGGATASYTCSHQTTATTKRAEGLPECSA